MVCVSWFPSDHPTMADKLAMIRNMCECIETANPEEVEVSLSIILAVVIEMQGTLNQEGK